VIPAEAREALGIAPGDKVLIMKKPDMPGLVVAKFESLRMLLDEMSAGLDAVNAEQPAEAADED
jgi:bifunctional DNA-binding transcriptional regulator/antitoxin component of YhaV-PrlF toxin-antitoxin module